MTLKEYIQSLPKERVQLAATDLNEATKIEQEHAALPGAIFDTADQIDGKGQANPAAGAADNTAEDAAQQPAAPTQSFDLTNDDDVKGFIKGMELSHPELVNRLRRDERAWDDMLALDSNYTARIQRDGQIKFTGDDKADYDFFRWAYGRGMLQSDTSIGGLASAFGRGLWQMAKGAAKLGATAAKSAANPAAAMELGATTVDAAQAAVAEYQQLGAGLAALTSGDNPQVKMAAMYELAKFADTEQKNHNAWRKAINDSFAEVPVDEDSVEFLSEAFDISNLIGAGAGKVVTTGLKRAGAAGAAELLGKSRKALGSEMLAKGLSKVPVIGTPYKRAILVGQADLLSEEAQIAYKSVAEAQADLAAKRATLAAAPAADPKDVLLKQVSEAEADVARKQAAFDAANTKLNTVRQGVSDALDLEGRGLLDRAAAGAVEGTGVAVRGTGRVMTRAYRGLSELLTGEADNAAFDMAAGQVAGNLANKGNIVTRIGQDMVAAGRTMAQNGATIPYFRRLRQAEDATKLTRGAAAFIDWSHLGWAADKVGDTLKAGAAGAPISGAFGYVASGGDLAAAAESAGAGAAYGIGGGAYGQWEAYTDPRFRYEELLANRRQFRDTLSARDVGGASQLQIFDQLDAGDQLAIATYAQGKPDVAFRFINDRNQASGYYDRDNNVVVINRASKTPVGDIFRHEVAHFVERHGLQAQVREMYLGDAEKGVIGQYTALDRLGNPVFVESTDPDGTTRYGYQLNEAGEKLKAEYESKIRAVDPTFKMSDEYLASELFAEQYADRMLGGGFRRDLSRNAVDNIVDALAAKPVLKNFLGGIGLLFDQNDNVVGTGVFKELKANEGVRRLISGFTSEVSKGKKPVVEDAADQHVFTEAELRNPELATKWLQGGGAMRFGPDGKPVYDSKGVPQFLTEKEADALQRDLANELITEIEKHVAANPADADVIQRREIVDVNGVKRTVFTGRRIPAAVIDALEAQKRFNPHQLAHLRAASASVEKHGTGAMIAHFYQAASRKLSGKAYKTVGGRWRRDGVVGFQITKDGNVVLNSVSWEQLAENATKAAKTKLAREVYATAGMPVDTAIMADVKTYLGNLVDGKPGATDIGEARRDFINNLLGIRMAANAEANPLFETTTAPKTILTNLRLDRINRMAPLDYVDVAWGPQQYRQAKANMRPEMVEGVKLEQFMQGGDRDLQFRPDDNFEEPEKTITAYKLFRTLKSKPGQLFPLFIGNNKPVPIGEWLVAENLPTKGFAARPGWHAGATPSAPHLMTRDGRMAEGRVWAEVQMPADIDYTPEALKQPTKDFKDRIPEGGFYKFSTQKEQGEHGWVIGGALKVSRILKPEEVDAINAKSGVKTKTRYDKANVQYRPDAHGRGIVNRGEDSLQFRPERNDETTRVAAAYVKKAFGREYDPHTSYDEAPEARLKEIADYFQNVAKHQPDAPEVLRSYRAMARETIEQYNAMIAAGIKPEPYRGKGEPYASSEDMMRDVRENKHLYFLRTDNAFGQGTQDAANPLLEKSGIKIGDFELLVNDVFRVVHDYFGHTQQGLQFGPRGEFNAWKSHSRMYSDEAQGAVAAETLAQNAWVNFGAHLRRADGSIPKKGEPDYVPPQDRPFGEQKNFLVPAEMMQFRPDDLGFVSQLERTLAAIPEKASRQQIEAALRDGVKEKGQLKERPVKAEEMADVRDVTGLSFAEWMKQNPQATREQMLDFARENRVRVSKQEMDGVSKYQIWQDGELTDAEFETEREADAYIQDQIKWYSDEHTIDDDGMTDPNGETLFTIKEKDGEFVVFDSSEEEVTRYNFLSSAKTFLRDQLDYMMQSEVRRYDIHEVGGEYYSDYTLPGGDNYRVHVLTLPKNSQGSGYTSSHFRETKNYLAHVRINDRTTPDGKSVLFAEEIQSDLHQSGRERGYKERKTKVDTTGWSVYKREQGEYGQRALLSTPYGYTSLGGGVVTDVAGMTDEQVVAKVAGEMWEAENRNKIPSAPFKKTWHEMAFKYLLQQAVDSGADYLGWTTGEQQSERYNLAKQVNSIEWDPAEQNKIVSIFPLGGDGNVIEFAVKPDGTVTGISGKWSGIQYEGKSISEVVGKDLGQRILNERDGRVSGNGLKVGGEGMKGFYDRIVPQFADKYLKKYGIKTEDIEVGTKQDPYAEREGDVTKVHAVRITPELKADISQYGQVQYRPETDGPARNEDAYARSKEHIEQAITPEQRYVGGYEPGKPVVRPSGREWHSDDLNAPVGNLDFSQKSIDEAFQNALDESGSAARRAVEALAADGHAMTPPGEKHWSDAGKNLKMVDRLWYEVSSEAMRKAFPSEDPKARLIQVADQIAATSPLADPNYNAELAISILSEMERGSPIYTPAVNMSGVSDAALGTFGAGESRKVGSFSNTFKFLGGAHNEPPLTTNDRQVAASFGIPDAAFGQYPVLYEVVSRFYNHLRDDYNARNGMEGGKWAGDDNGPMQSHQLQAISWVQTRAETRMENRKAITEEDAFNGDAYHSAFKLAADRLREGGVSVPVDDNGDPMFTREVLSDPRVTQILAPTTEDFRNTLMLTQEIGTNLTETGKKFNDLVAKSKELGIAKNLEEADKITNRYLNALGQRTKVEGKAKKDPSVMGKLVSAFAGRAVDVSRIEKGWGSFMGDFSKNLRVPIEDVPERFRGAFISVIGRQLKQAAGAASKFLNTDSAQPAANATRTYSVFLPGVLEPSTNLATFAKELSAAGHEVNVQERPNGLVIDVNPAFGDSGPVGIDPAVLHNVVSRAFGDKARISAADHSSYYVDSTQYGTKIAEARKTLLNEAARDISRYFPSVRSAKDFIRSTEDAGGQIASANERRRAEAVRARYTESIRLLESAEKDLAQVMKEFHRDMEKAMVPLQKRIDKAAKKAAQ